MLNICLFVALLLLTVFLLLCSTTVFVIAGRHRHRRRCCCCCCWSCFAVCLHCCELKCSLSPSYSLTKSVAHSPLCDYGSVVPVPVQSRTNDDDVDVMFGCVVVCLSVALQLLLCRLYLARDSLQSWNDSSVKNIYLINTEIDKKTFFYIYSKKLAYRSHIQQPNTHTRFQRAKESYNSTETDAQQQQQKKNDDSRGDSEWIKQNTWSHKRITHSTASTKTHISLKLHEWRFCVRVSTTAYSRLAKGLNDFWSAKKRSKLTTFFLKSGKYRKRSDSSV